MGKYLVIFHLEVGESTGLLKANWEMSLPIPLKISCDRYPKERRVSHVSRSSKRISTPF